jgi:hypothetical protein
MEEEEGGAFVPYADPNPDAEPNSMVGLDEHMKRAYYAPGALYDEWAAEEPYESSPAIPFLHHVMYGSEGGDRTDEQIESLVEQAGGTREGSRFVHPSNTEQYEAMDDWLSDWKREATPFLDFAQKAPQAEDNVGFYDALKAPQAEDNVGLYDALKALKPLGRIDPSERPRPWLDGDVSPGSTWVSPHPTKKLVYGGYTSYIPTEGHVRPWRGQGPGKGTWQD